MSEEAFGLIVCLVVGAVLVWCIVTVYRDERRRHKNRLE